MGKCIAYTAAAVVFMGVGALIAGACVWFLAPREKEDKINGIQEFRYAKCDLIPANNVEGVIFLQQLRSGPNNPLNITTNITGLPEGLHGFHIHEYGVPLNGDCSDCKDHFNPKGVDHGSPNSTERHVGDLGNINVTDSNEETVISIQDNVAKLWGDESVVGRSIVIHEDEDDLGLNQNQGSLKTGNAGKRLACCTIYLVKA